MSMFGILYSSPVCVVLELESWVTSLNSTDFGVATIITAVEVQYHWIPIVWRKDAKSLLAFVANASEPQAAVIVKLHHAMCRAWGVPESDLCIKQIACDTLRGEGCGLLAIEFVDHLLSGRDLDVNSASLMAKHSLLRQGFVDSLTDVVPRPWIWG